jgi:hypothetical protein
MTGWCAGPDGRGEEPFVGSTGREWGECMREAPAALFGAGE